MQIEVCRDCVPDNLDFLRRVPFAYEKIVNLTTAADGKATCFKRNSPGIGKADVVENSGGKLALRFCFVNWRTTADDVDEIVELLETIGAEAATAN